jgi:glycopeptide antibiotics resistance protein
MNVVVFVPVGLLAALVIYNKLKLFKAGLFTVAFGLFISASIEALQFFLERGFSELDDVFHNTIGCLIGFMIVAIIEGIWLLQKRYLTN